MKIVKFLGGLGNQMFQHAFLIALRETSKEVVYIDLFDYERYQQHNGYELDKIFGIHSPIASKKDIWKYTCLFKNVFLYKVYTKLSFLRKTDIKERHSYKYYPNIISEHKDGYYDGFWQSHNYFDKYKETILKDFVFPEPSDSRNSEIISNIINDEKSVCIHVRRGDYLKSDMYKGLCGLDYYRKAIAYITAKFGTGISFYIFSNDIGWCKENIVKLLPANSFTFVDWNSGTNSYRDLQLMSLCRGCVIANSSFSWWAAYLNQRNNNVIVAPNKWVNSPLEFQMQLPEWILL